jgi:hypothetical protein
MSGPAFSQESETSEEMPTAEELDAMNLRIGAIEIDSRNIFDLDDPEEDRWLYRWANKLHVVTKPQVIRSQLLLNEGDSYSSRLVDESERILRANEYLREASIEPLRVEDGTVDLRVSTADVWSLTPDITLGREGGENRFGLGLLERNLLGHGLLLGFKYRSDVDRDTATLDFANPHFRGSRSPPFVPRWGSLATRGETRWSRHSHHRDRCRSPGSERTESHGASRNRTDNVDRDAPCRA